MTILLPLLCLFTADPKSVVVVKVNGVAIHRSDLLFAASQQEISEEQLPEQEPRLVEQLIESQLIRAFLSSKKVEPNIEELQFQIATAEEFIRKRGEDPQKLLAKLGYTPERMRRELGLPLAWKNYATQTISNQQIRDYFQEHKQELDGTQLRGRQVFMKAARGKDREAIETAKSKLAELRRQIVEGTLSFEDAAKNYSDAPSRDEGGDVGLFGWRGKLPPEVCQAAFSLKVGEISEPIVTHFGAHLIQVTERHPGDFSVEDVRSVIFDRMSQDLWKSTVARELKTAKIERPRRNSSSGN